MKRTKEQAWLGHLCTAENFPHAKISVQREGRFKVYAVVNASFPFTPSVFNNFLLKLYYRALRAVALFLQEFFLSRKKKQENRLSYTWPVSIMALVDAL